MFAGRGKYLTVAAEIHLAKIRIMCSDNVLSFTGQANDLDLTSGKTGQDGPVALYAAKAIWIGRCIVKCKDGTRKMAVVLLVILVAQIDGPFV